MNILAMDHRRIEVEHEHEHDTFLYVNVQHVHGCKWIIVYHISLASLDCTNVNSLIYIRPLDLPFPYILVQDLW